MLRMWNGIRTGGEWQRMKRRAAVAAVILGLCTPALADDTWMEQVMTFSLDGDHILAEGAFAPDTADTFQAFISQNAPDSGPWNKALYIRSPGGALGAAISMGHILRERGMSVVAFDLCASACTYMLMGGVNRVVTREAQYGVHQFSFGDASADPEKPFFTAKDIESHQMMVGELADYTETMGVDTHVVLLASRTPPANVTFLTRDQLVKYHVDNVPTDEDGGQSNGSVVIPGVTETEMAAAPSDTSIFESLKIRPHRLSSNISLAMARRLVMAETQDLAGMEESLANSYAANVEYNGRLVSGDSIVAEKRRMVKDWGVRNRSIVEDSLTVNCEEDDLWCTVSGDYDYELGVAEGGFLSKNRWHFTMDIMVPLVLPRVMKETLSEVE